MVREVLAPLGYTNRRAPDGAEALEAVKRDVPDIILCDVVMPNATDTPSAGL